MTVNELLQKLVELARDGKGQWPITVMSYNNEIGWADTIEVNDRTKEVCIEA